VGEFSGIDAGALQQMTSSFTADKDHLRASVSSYRSQFAGKGLDTSPLTELLGICGWLDDQIPMLTRRYHLAIAADRPYPGHKGMVSVDDSLVGTRAQSEKDGKALADKFTKALDGGDDPSEDLFVALQAHADDADYLKAFYAELGPQHLMVLTNDIADDNMYSRYGDHPDQAVHDRDILARTFGTYTKVAFEGRSSKDAQAAWGKWFDSFQDPRGQFRADYLTGLLPGGSQDKDFLVALGDRVFGKDPSKNGSEFMNGGGLGKGEFGKDHYTQLFTAIAGNPEASGEWMDHNYDTMQTIIYPHGPWDLGQPPSRAQAFANLMKSGTITLKTTDTPLAEKLTARILMDNYRHQNGDMKDVHTYDPIDLYYSQLVGAYWDDMEYGITSPTGDKLWGADATAGGFTEKMSQWDQKAFLAHQDPKRPGLEAGAPLWQALLNESARNPTAAGEMSALFDAYRNKIDQTRSDTVKPTPEHAQDYLSMKRGLMMKAYASAFTYAENSIEGDADKWAEDVNNARATMVNAAYDTAKVVLTDGAGAAATGAKDDAVSFAQDTARELLTGWLVQAISVKPEDAPGNLADKYKKINDAQLDTSWQDEYRRLANDQVDPDSYGDGVIQPVVVQSRQHPQNSEKVPPTLWYSGDPYGRPPKGHPDVKVPTYIHGPADNFLTSDGKVKDIGDMTPQQRTAYDKWLQDPAVVNRVEQVGFSQGVQFQNLPDA
jgi:hypothetical protein